MRRVKGFKRQNWKDWAIGVAVVIVAHAAILGVIRVITSASHQHKLRAAEAAAAERAKKVPEPVPVFILPPPTG